MHKNRYFFLALLAGYSIGISSYIPTDKIWRGSIKFPSHAKHISPVAIYYTGIRIEKMQCNAHQVSFDIPESKIRNTFHLVITEPVDPTNERNTITSLCIAQNSSYKYYLMEFVPTNDICQPTKQIDAEHMGSWLITEKLLGPDRQIPDDAIIVYLDPHMVHKVEGGNGLELPKIILDEQLFTQLNKEELQDAFALFSLASIDINSIHARQQVHIKPDFAKKTIISMIYA